MPPAGFEPKIPASEWPQTHSLERAATGIDTLFITFSKLFKNYKSKGKSVPLQAWSGPEVSNKLNFLDYMTTAQDGGKVVSLTHRPPLPAGNAPGTHFC